MGQYWGRYACSKWGFGNCPAPGKRDWDWKFDLLLYLAFESKFNEIKGQNPYKYVKEHVYYWSMILHVNILRGIKVVMARKDRDDVIE